MMWRVRTGIVTRNPYLMSDITWGFTYVAHGLMGVGFVGLVIAHIYFALRPEKLWITKAMVFGYITRREYLEHHDPDQWVDRGIEARVAWRLRPRAKSWPSASTRSRAATR